MKKYFLIFILIHNIQFSYCKVDLKEKKILICGVGKNVEFAVKNNIKNIEKLGKKFKDYAVIIYENNSSDNTRKKFKKWSKVNSRVLFISENLRESQLPSSREEVIARARNIVLLKAFQPIYDDFDYLLMVDLDFITPWPIQAIVRTLQSPIEWDCVSSNSIREHCYWDRYAFRDSEFPFGPELIGEEFWHDLNNTWFRLKQDNWKSVYSAFGGLAIYKMSSIRPFSYSGTVTDDLRIFYSNIINFLPCSDKYVEKYLRLNQLNIDDGSEISIIFRENVPCCEHLTLHASMYIHGYNKMYINPKMKMNYN